MTYSKVDRAWKYTFTVPERASTLAFCFNDGGTTWDNNGGDNWTFPVTGTVVPEAWFTGTCAVTNRAEQPYAPLEIGYNPTGRDLAVAAAVYVHLGVVTADGTNWTSYAMSDQGGFWTFGFTPEVGTTGLIACFHDGGTVWDNNDSANWSFDLGENYATVDEGLAVTTPAETTTVETDKATIHGTAGANIIGPITWTNAAAGVGGTFEAAPLWSQEVPLAGGSNEIVFTAQTLGEGTGGYSSDKAANYDQDENYKAKNKGDIDKVSSALAKIMEEDQTIVAMGAGAISKVYFPAENRLERVPNVSNYQIYIERIDEMIARKEAGIQ